MSDIKVLNEKLDNYQCIKCNSKNEYHIIPNEIKMFRNGVVYTYTELTAICNKCKSQIYIPYLNDFNVSSQYKAYNKALLKINASFNSKINPPMNYKEAADIIENHMVVHKLKENGRAVKITEALELAVKLLREKSD